MAAFNHNTTALRCKSLLITIGDSFDSVESDIFIVVDAIANMNNFDNDNIIELFLKCVESFTFKTGIYASIAGILNNKENNSFSKNLCSNLQSRIKNYLIQGERVKFILLFRFYIALHCVKFNVNVFDFIAKLIQLLDDIQDKLFSSNDIYNVSLSLLSDNISYSILCSIPWFDRNTFTEHSVEIKKIITKCTDYIMCRSKIIDKLKNSPSKPDIKLYMNNIANNNISKLSYCGEYYYLKCYNDIYDGKYDDILSQSLSAIQSFVKNDYKSSVTFRFHQMPNVKSSFSESPISTDNLLIDNNEIISGLWHPILAKPLEINKICKLESKDISQHDIWLIKEHVIATINSFKTDCKQCATQLLRIPINSSDKEILIVKMVLNLMLENLSDDFFISFNTLLLCHISTMQLNIEDLVDKEITIISSKVSQMDYSALNKFISFCAYWYSFSLSKISLSHISKFKDILNTVQSNPKFTNINDISIIELLSDEDRKRLMESRNKEISDLMLHKKIPYRIKLLEKISRLLFVDRYYYFIPQDLRDYIDTSASTNFLGIDVSLAFNKTFEFEAITKLLHIKKMGSEEYAMINSRIHNFITSMIGKPALTQSFDKIYDRVTTSDDNANKYCTAEGKIWSCDELVEIALCALFQYAENKSQSHINRLIDNHWNLLSNLPIEDNHLILRTLSKLFSKNLKRLELVIEHLVTTECINPSLVVEFIFTIPIESPNYSFWIDLIDLVLMCNKEIVNETAVLLCNKIKEYPSHVLEYSKYFIHYLRRWYKQIEFPVIIDKIDLSVELMDVIILFAHLPKNIT